MFKFNFDAPSAAGERLSCSPSAAELNLLPSEEIMMDNRAFVRVSPLFDSPGPDAAFLLNLK